MKYYSEVTKAVYDTEADLVAAETEVMNAKKAKEALKAQREERAKEVEAALAEAREAQKKATDLLNAFCKDYGSFHTTVKNGIKPSSFIDMMFNIL